MKIRLIKNGYSTWQIQKSDNRLSTPSNPYWINYWYPKETSYIDYSTALKDYEEIKRNNGNIQYNGIEVIKEDEI